MSRFDALMAELIRGDATPDEAASAAMDEALAGAFLSGEAREWLYGLALREARHLEGRHVNKRMKRVLGRGRASGDIPLLHEEISRKMQRTVYRTPDGATVLWDDMTTDRIEVKLAYLRKQVGAILDHVAILEAARGVLAERGAARLGDIPGWVALVRKKAAAQAPAA